MSFELDSIDIDDDYLDCADWMQAVGLWDGRHVTIEQAPAFQKEVEARLTNLLYSLNPASADFQKLGALLATLGTVPEKQAPLARDIQALRITAEGVVVLASFGKSINTFWKEHKTAILIGAGLLAIGGVIAIVYVCSAGAAGLWVRQLAQLLGF